MSFFMYFVLRKIKMDYDDLLKKKSVNENILIKCVFSDSEKKE